MSSDVEKHGKNWAQKMRLIQGGPRGTVTTDPPKPGSGDGEYRDPDGRILKLRSLITYKPLGELFVDNYLLSLTDFGGKLEGSVDLDAGRSGKVVLGMLIEGVEIVSAGAKPESKDFRQYIGATWDISADSSGKLVIGKPLPEIEKRSGDASYRLASLNHNEQIDPSPFVSLSPIMASTADSENSNFGETVTPFGVGFGGSTGEGRESPPSPTQKSFRLNIKVNVPKTPTKPDPKVEVKVHNVMTVTAKYSYEYGPFAVGKAVPEKGNVRDWVNELLFEILDDEAQHQMRNGVLPGGEKVELWGYASNTGSTKLNDELSLQRINAIVKEFKFYGVPNNVFITEIPRGKRDVPEGKEKEDPNWRKVVVKIRHAKQHVQV